MTVTHAKVEVVDYDELCQLTPAALATLRAAFVGRSAFGIVGVRGAPGYDVARREAFRTAVELAVHDEAGRERCAAVRQTYPGWNGTPGTETHPLQSNFLHNIKEGVGARPAVDPYFGENRWPDARMKRDFTALNAAMYPASLAVMRGCDALLREALGDAVDGRPSFEQIGEGGTTLAGRWIW